MGQFRALQTKGNKEIQQGREARSAKLIEMRAHIDAVKVQYADFDAKLGQRDQIVKVLGDARNALQTLPARLSAVERAGAAADRRDASCALPQAQIDSLQAAPNPYIAEIARWQRRHDDHRAKIPELVKRLNEIREDIADLKVLECCLAMARKWR
jgi:chromosome segregation ATPase